MTERKALKNIYEIWAGSEGIPVPETAVEAYLLRLIEQMRDEASRALAEPEQEPVAWLSKSGKGIWFHAPDASLDATPLCTARPQRQWVGLTDDEVIDCWRQSNGYGKWEEFAKAIEARLKEKNHD